MGPRGEDTLSCQRVDVHAPAHAICLMRSRTTRPDEHIVTLGCPAGPHARAASQGTGFVAC